MLAFVTAMIVCYLKPKLRARVVSLLLTILVITMRSGRCYDTGLFFNIHSSFPSPSCYFFRVKLSSDHKKPTFLKPILWAFFISAISSFFYPVLLWIFLHVSAIRYINDINLMLLMYRWYKYCLL